MNKKQIIRFVLIFVLAALAGILLQRFSGTQTHQAICARCNVIIVTIDTLRADSLPCYGYALNTAPNICRFAQSNVLLKNAYANSNWTLPSNFSIMTSLYPVSHGMVEPLLNKMSSRITTLAQRLAQQGYMTSFISEDEANIGVETDIARGFGRIHISPRALSDETMQMWNSAIDSVKTANMNRTPAFVYLHTSDLHDYVGNLFQPPVSFPLDPSYTPPPILIPTTFTTDAWNFAIDYLTDEIQRSSVTSDINRYSAWREQLKNAHSLEEAQTIFATLPADMHAYIFMTLAKRKMLKNSFDTYANFHKHLYDDSIRTVDIRMGQLLQHMDQDGIMENTIVIIMSDHGQLLGEHQLIGHVDSSYDEILHVPLIMHIPGLSAHPTSALVQLIDLYPTLLDLVGVPVPESVAGKNISNLLLQEKSATTNSFVISQTRLPQPTDSIRTNQWHYIESNGPMGKRNELYNLITDPNELDNVAGKNITVESELAGILHAQLAVQPVYPPTSSAIPEWPSNEARLNAINQGPIN